MPSRPIPVVPRRAAAPPAQRWGSAALALALAACAGGPAGAETQTLSDARGDGPKVLCVVAHPDDELAFAGTLYKIATHLGGRCDIFVITNGEGGYKYSTLGERIYGLRLTDPAVGRAELPRIRKREHAEGGRILGVRRVYYLNQRDHRYTLDPGEVLADDAGIWDLGRVRTALREVLRRGRYDFVFTHLPTPDSHGHHKAATILALEVLAGMPEAERPIALGAYATGRTEEAPEPPEQLAGFAITRVHLDAGPFVFDRTQKFGYRQRLDYHIVVNWAIAAHKSQGSFQTLMKRWNKETYRLYALPAPDAVRRTAELFRRLAEPQFAALDYDADGESK